MITKLQFCHDVSVSDVGDLVKVILASVIIYCFDFTVGSHFVALIRIYCSLSLACNPPPPQPLRALRSFRSLFLWRVPIERQ